MTKRKPNTKKEEALISQLRRRKMSPEHLDMLIAEVRNPTLKASKTTHHRPLEGATFKYGVYGDRHIGSKYHDAKALAIFGEKANDWGVEFMLDCGDSVDGSFNMHRGMWQEQSHLGFDAQLEELIRTTPDLGVPIYHINGNHDYNWLKSEGVDLGKNYEKGHKDVVHLGTSSAMLQVGKTKIQLLHPGGGSSYALSHRPQKIVESLEGGKKPEILHINHYHKMCQMFYRNVHAFMDGTFQSQSHFMMERGLAAHKGSWLLEVSPDKFGGVADIVTKFVPFYK